MMIIIIIIVIIKIVKIIIVVVIIIIIVVLIILIVVIIIIIIARPQAGPLRLWRLKEPRQGGGGCKGVCSRERLRPPFGSFRK